MSWLPATFRSAADDARRRAHAAEEDVRGAAERVKEKVVDKAEETARAVQQAVRPPHTSPAPPLPAPSKAATAQSDRDVAAFAKNATAARVSPMPRFTGPPSPPPQIVPGVGEQGSTAEHARPFVMAAGGFGTALVSGKLGPGGAVAQWGFDLVVDRYGSPQDKYDFGAGQTVAGVVTIGQGALVAGGGGAIEVGTLGLGTAVAVPAMVVGAADMAVGVSHVQGGQWLMSRGAPAAPAARSRGPVPASAGTPGPGGAGAAPDAKPVAAPKLPRTPTGINDRHILNGEIKYRADGTPKAQGFHHEGPGTKKNARIVEGTKTKPNAQGVYKAEVKIRDPRTGAWVRKERISTFFPEKWDRSEVRKAILEAFANRTVRPDGSWTGTGRVIRIKGFTDPAGRITSAYPEL